MMNTDVRVQKMNKIAAKVGNTFGRLKRSQSTGKLRRKLEKLEEKFPDLILLNEEFSCNDEIHLLPRDFGRTNSEFLNVR